MIPVPYRVTDRRAETADTATLDIEPVDTPLEPPRPGQFHMLWCFGVGEVPISVSRVADGDAPQQHTIRAVGATTRALCDLTRGDTLGVRGPFGRGWDLATAEGRDVLVVAGGLGLAPVRPLVDEVIDHRDRFGRVVVLIGARSPQEIPLTEVVAAWRGRFDLDVEITVDHARDGWYGDVGVVTTMVPRAPVDFAATAAFVCGPEVMMRFTGTALRDAGVAAERIQVSLERNMVCAVAHCGHCQLGPTFVCREGPVYPLDAAGPLLAVRSL